MDGDIDLDEIERICALESALQHRPEMTSNMALAWHYAIEFAKEEPKPDASSLLAAVRLLGSLIEPEKNKLTDWRDVNVRVGYSIKPHHSEVPYLMLEWGEAVTRDEEPLTPAEAFRELEEIHPFRDGNGRVGLVIYNLLKGTLGHPEMPPDFWYDPRRVGLEGRGWIGE